MRGTMEMLGKGGFLMGVRLNFQINQKNQRLRGEGLEYSKGVDCENNAANRTTVRIRAYFKEWYSAHPFLVAFICFCACAVVLKIILVDILNFELIAQGTWLMILSFLAMATIIWCIIICIDQKSKNEEVDPLRYSWYKLLKRVLIILVIIIAIKTMRSII